jgi:DNA-binding HxlR family transcriptional regulator
MASMWHLIGQVRASTYRERVLLALDTTMTPAQLHAAIKTISRPHITRSLRELQALRLVKLLNPQTPRYHLYDRTTQGNEIARAIKRLQ